MSIYDHVTVNVIAQDATVTQQGFGTALIVAYHEAWVGPEVRTYQDPLAMLDDGFAVTGPSAVPYLMAAALKAQQPSVTEFKVARRATGATVIKGLTFVAQGTGYVHTVTLRDSSTGLTDEISYTEVALDTDQDVADGILAAAGALTTDVAASAGGAAEVLFTSTTPGNVLGLTFGKSATVDDQTTNAAGIATDLANVIVEDNDWYGLLTDATGALELADVAGFAETNKKLHIASSSDSAILDPGSTTDIAYTSQAAARNYTAILFSENDLEFAGAAWMGWGLPVVPGAQTWKFATLAGVTFSPLTSTQRNAALTKDANVYVRDGGLNITDAGTLASGRFIDLQRTIDKLRARIAESVFGTLARPRKVPFTDVGGAILQGAVKQPMVEMEDDGALVVGSSVVIVPKVATISVNDRAARLFRTIRASTVAQGAVHDVVVDVSVSV